MADVDRLQQVVWNLLSNAIKFTPAGGRVRVGAAACPSGGEVRLWVTDSGPGIPAEHLPHIFRRFWQANSKDSRGIGLGLSIAEGIVEAHGGRIWVESQVGAGSNFYFTLPAVEGGG